MPVNDLTGGFLSFAGILLLFRAFSTSWALDKFSRLPALVLATSGGPAINNVTSSRFSIS